MPKISIPSVRSSMVGNRQLPGYSDVKTRYNIPNFKYRVHRPAVLATEYTIASPITGCSCRMAFYASYHNESVLRPRNKFSCPVLRSSMRLQWAATQVRSQYGPESNKRKR